MRNLTKMSTKEIDKQIEKLSTKAYSLKIEHKEKMEKINTRISDLMREKLKRQA